MREWVFRLGWALHRAIYRATGGRLGRRTGGMPVLALTTTGRRSGLPRTVLLSYLDHDGAFVVIASNIGRDTHPAWWLNLAADPVATVEANGTVVPVRARNAIGAERAALWRRVVEVQPAYSGYATRTEREIPVVVLEPVADAP